MPEANQTPLRFLLRRPLEDPPKNPTKELRTKEWEDCQEICQEVFGFGVAPLCTLRRRDKDEASGLTNGRPPCRPGVKMAMAAACHYVCVAFRMLLEDFWTVAKGLEDLEIKELIHFLPRKCV